MIGRHAIVAWVVALAGVPLVASAGGQRTFVASTGDDGDPCSLSLPCRSFAAAILQTNAGGEVVVLDSGGYGRIDHLAIRSLCRDQRIGFGGRRCKRRSDGQGSVARIIDRRPRGIVRNRSRRRGRVAHREVRGVKHGGQRCFRGREYRDRNSGYRDSWQWRRGTLDILRGAGSRYR